MRCCSRCGREIHELPFPCSDGKDHVRPETPAKLWVADETGWKVIFSGKWWACENEARRWPVYEIERVTG